MTPSQLTGSPLSDRIVDLLAQVPDVPARQARAFALLQAFRKVALRIAADSIDPATKAARLEGARQELAEMLEWLIPEKPTPTHSCSVAGCGEQVPTHQLMCRRHWCLVPHVIRMRVAAAFDQYQRGEIHLDRLRAVQQVATEAVSGGGRKGGRS